jgi:hypothetical protein
MEEERNGVFWRSGPRGYPGGNKCSNLDLLVGGVSKIETINYAHESRRTQI